MKLQDITYQYFGSGDSVDVDVVFFVDALGSVQENLEVANQLGQALKMEQQFEAKVNPNLAVVQGGKIVQVYKGTVDELNNALFHTYEHHRQPFPLQIDQLLPRDQELKLLKTLHKTLSFFTRTGYRKEIKAALRGGFSKQLAFLKAVDITGIPIKEESQADIWKVIMFSMAQVMALEEGLELYTKRGIIESFPFLEGIMKRSPPLDKEAVTRMLQLFIAFAEAKVEKGLKQEFD